MIRKMSLAWCLMLFLEAHATEALPRDVQQFIDNREGCDHMRGEEPEPGDHARARSLKREINKLCKGTDRKLANLKKKYAANPVVLQRLSEFEPQIEMAEPSKQRR